MTDYAITILEGSLGASVAITLDVLDTASMVCQSLQQPPIKFRVLGSRPSIKLSNGLSVEVEELKPDPERIQTPLIVPGLGLCMENTAGGSDSDIKRYDPALISERLDRNDARHLADILAQHHFAGGTVAASCSGVLILARAGLLVDRQVTTHWRLYDYLREQCPSCHVDVARMVIADESVITAGAAMAQMDLMLHLIRCHQGQQVADLTMRYLLLDGRHTQSRYMVFSHLNSSDDLVYRLENMVEEAMPDIPSLRQLATELWVSEKTLSRRVHKASGMSPQALIQNVRLRRALSLLETTRLSIQEVANQVGYSDTSALRKLTLKHLKLTPGQLRKRRH